MALLTCSDVTFSYEGIPVLTDVNFALEAASYLCIVGENGSHLQPRRRKPPHPGR